MIKMRFSIVILYSLISMAYSDFTLRKFKKDFGLQIDEQRNLFSSVSALSCSDYLVQTLQENVSLAIAINTEKHDRK